MKLPIAYYGDPILRKKCISVDEITDEIRVLVEDMLETMRENNGIGLAAPQVHEGFRIFVTQVPYENEQDEWQEGTVRVYINPTIISYSNETHIDSEGCISIPTLRSDVERPYKITVKATDIDGNSFELNLEGLEARCVLHENDHINGVLFIDRIKGKERKLLEPKLRKIKKDYSKK